MTRVYHKEFDKIVFSLRFFFTEVAELFWEKTREPRLLPLELFMSYVIFQYLILSFSTELTASVGEMWL